MIQLKLADIFQSKMVLQRQKPIRLWGTAEFAENGTELKVTLGEAETACYVKDGAFYAELPPMEAARGLVLTVHAVQEEDAEITPVVLEDVCVGDVYLAGGQSNMEYRLRWEAHFEDLRMEPENPDIRMFNVTQIAYEGQKRNMPAYGFWFTKEHRAWREFSAIGYVFAKYIQDEVGVPVGIIGCNWGGTPAVAWMSEEYANREPIAVFCREYEDAIRGVDPDDLKRQSEIAWEYEDSYRNWVKWQVNLHGLNLEEQALWQKEYADDPAVPMGPYHHYRPTTLYHNMLKTVAPMPIRGVLWYQGESDSGHGEIYDQTFGAMVECWRETWQDPELPFFTVQLAPFGQWLDCFGDSYPTVRESQLRAAKNIPNVYMTSIMDIGMYDDIHPKEKCEIARRLALLAMQHVYELPVNGETPEITEVIRRGNQIILYFNNVEDGMEMEGCQINALSVQQNGAEVVITDKALLKDKLVLTCRDLTDETVQIAYAWVDYCEVNLFNSEGLPVKPFCGEV